MRRGNGRRQKSIVIHRPIAVIHGTPKDEQSVLLRKGHSWHNGSYPVSRTGASRHVEHEKVMEVFPVPQNQREILTA
jgi:hypothetical protein